MSFGYLGDAREVEVVVPCLPFDLRDEAKESGAGEEEGGGRSGSVGGQKEAGDVGKASDQGAA